MEKLRTVARQREALVLPGTAKPASANLISRFAVADGSVTAGPATTPLPEKTVAVQDDAVVLS